MKLKKVFRFFGFVFIFVQFFLLKVGWAGTIVPLGDPQVDPRTEWQIQGTSGVLLRIARRGTADFPPDLEVSDPIEASKRSWFPWDPTGLNNYPVTSACRQESLRDLIWKDTNPKVQARALTEWVNRCDQEINTRGSKRSLLPLARFATVRYNFAANPDIRVVQATLPDGRFLSGFLALKPGGAARPFVIAKCGVLCNVENSTAQRTFVMHLYDESPFHVLALANNTGSDFQIDNEALSVGGFDEGRQLYQIAQILRSPDSPIRSMVSSVHVVGISLGASGALYSGMYSSANDLPGQEHIQSVMGICPVVVVESAVARLYSSKSLSRLASLGTLRQLREIFSYVPIVGEFFPSNPRKIRGEKLYQRLSQAILTYYQQWTAESPWDLKPFNGLRIQSLKEFWHLNDFRNYTQHVRVPTLTIAAENDDLVKTEEHSKLLTRSLQWMPNDKIGTAYFKHGNHCAFAVANGWGNFSTLLREYILSHSAEAPEHWRPQTVRGPFQGLVFGPREEILETSWQARVGDPSLWLKLKVYSPRWNYQGRIGCGYKNRLSAPRFCYREVQLAVPLATLPGPMMKLPQTEHQVTVLTRWANTRLSVLDRQGELVVNSNHSPEYIRAWLWH